MIKGARKHHLKFFQLLQLIFDERGKTETVLPQSPVVMGSCALGSITS
ncbi:hypothetical protein T05_6769 [Trichinella murrelli]|uniref:Uncharacterized protein n=1 Tax=Trichinella murrelli TaxID=144512 RepID=A0A0V0T3L1_9BILA|nr:hypothetical protein T05_6769 [Trichinella murrelli]